jgi:hypothetical protein
MNQPVLKAGKLSYKLSSGKGKCKWGPQSSELKKTYFHIERCHFSTFPQVVLKI